MGYKIIASELIRERLRRLQQEAVIHGQGPAFLAAMKQLTAEMQTDPYKAGEINFHLSRGEPFCSTVRGPLAIKFAIYEQAQIVWIVRVDRLAAPHE